MLRRQFAARLSLLPAILATSHCSAQTAEYSAQTSPARGGHLRDSREEDGLRGVADQVMRPVVDNGAIPGTIVGISLRGARHFFRYSARGEQLAPNTIVEIGSITKVFTTALLAQAIQDGSIQPNASIQSCLPDTRLQRCASAVTPVQLASFRSGMPALPTNAPQRLNERGLGNYTMGDFLNWVSQWSPAGCQLPAPYEYSNASVGLLGPILANARGVPWARQIEASITGPLGMRDTSIRPGPDAQGRVAQGHGPAGRQVIPWPVFAWLAAGALRSTA